MHAQYCNRQKNLVIAISLRKDLSVNAAYIFYFYMPGEFDLALTECPRKMTLFNSERKYNFVFIKCDKELSIVLQNFLFINAIKRSLVNYDIVFVRLMSLLLNLTSNKKQT